MNLTLQFDRTGPADVLACHDMPLPDPAPGQVRLRHLAIGVNFIDTYYRSGLYPLALPSGLGSEAAGEVVAVGDGVTRFKPGDRVAYAGGPQGAYCQYRNIDAEWLVGLPEGIDPESAACMMLQGMTVEYLIRRTFPVETGQTVLWHAAAGGVGQIAAQWLASLGVQVIGTAGSEEKLELARKAGCRHVINYRTENVVEKVREITAGRGVPVVYDSVGKDTFAMSVDCLAPRGMLVSFGNASGPVPPFEPLLLSRKGSLFFTRPRLGDYIATRSELDASSQALFERVLCGAVKVAPSHRYPLAEAAEAHRDLENRRTTGSVILIP